MNDKNAVIAGVVAVAIVLATAACALVPEGATKDTINTQAARALVVVRDFWIPAMHTYARQPRCDAPSPAPCLDVKVYTKLYVATDAATLCAQMATRQELTLLGWENCKVKFDATRRIFFNELKIESPGVEQ